MNQGEQLHAVLGALFNANDGHIRQRTQEQQTEQALCLSILVIAIVGLEHRLHPGAIDVLRAAGELIATSEVGHVFPIVDQNNHF